MSYIQKALTNQGFVITDILFEPRVLESLLKDLTDIGAFNYDQPQIPNLLKACEALNKIAYDKLLLSLLRLATGEEMFPVKAFILDKSTESNWEIPWHQDLKIALSEKAEVPGYHNWSVESGILHVQPPESVMEKLVTIRIHFDACDFKNAIRVIPRSHKLGILTQQQIEHLVEQTSSHLCIAAKFSVMLMRPLILHYSPPSRSSSSRRILQIEYGCNLGNGLSWHDAVYQKKPHKLL
jgi:hypothetical protein